MIILNEITHPLNHKCWLLPTEAKLLYKCQHITIALVLMCFRLLAITPLHFSSSENNLFVTKTMRRECSYVQFLILLFSFFSPTMRNLHIYVFHFRVSSSSLLLFKIAQLLGLYGPCNFPISFTDYRVTGLPFFFICSFLSFIFIDLIFLFVIYNLFSSHQFIYLFCNHKL